MEQTRKKFLRNIILGATSVPLILEACKKSSSGGSGSGTGACTTSPEEVEGPYPYVGGEITNPLNRSDVTGGQTGVSLTLNFTAVNTNNNCAAVANARVDIWHCNKDGYYSGYNNQTGGALGTQSYGGQTWLRGYQLTDTSGKTVFTTIYPGWYQGRATHIHIEVYVNNVLKKTTQITFPESISDTVHVSTLYAAHGVNTTRTAADGIFNNSAADMANETVALTGSIAAGYSGNYTIGLAL